MAGTTDPKKTRPILDDRRRTPIDSRSCDPIEGVFSCLAVDTVKRINRANPKDSLPILVNTIYHRSAEAVFFARFVIEFLKERRSNGKVVGGHHVQSGPNIPFAVLKQGAHIVFADTLRISRIMTVADEPHAFPVKFQKAVDHCSKP